MNKTPVTQIELKDVTLMGAKTSQPLSLNFELNKIFWLKGDLAKSNILSVMAGLKKPLTGQYLINQSSVYDMSFEEFLPLRMNIGYSFALGGLLNDHTLYENLVLAHTYHGATQEEADQAIQETVNIFSLNEFLHVRPSAVSGAIRKLCCLARALSLEPQILLLDNPTHALEGSPLKLLKGWLSMRKGKVTTIMTAESGEFFYGSPHCTVEYKDGELNIQDIFEREAM